MEVTKQKYDPLYLRVSQMYKYNCAYDMHSNEWQARSALGKSLADLHTKQEKGWKTFQVKEMKASKKERKAYSKMGWVTMKTATKRDFVWTETWAEHRYQR